MNTPSAKDHEEYSRIQSRLDDLIKEMLDFIVAFAKDNATLEEDGLTDGPHVMFGWVLGIGVTRYGEDGEDDDMVLVNSKGLNNYTAAGMGRILGREYEENAQFGTPDDED